MILNTEGEVFLLQKPYSLLHIHSWLEIIILSALLSIFFLSLGLDSSTRTLSTPSPGLILPSKSSSLSSPALSSNGHETNSSSSSSAPAETVAVVHPQPGTHTRSRQSKSHHHAPIDLLPDHTLLQIFSHLPTNQLCRCARVCRRWYNLAWDPRLWSTIRLTGELLHADRAIRVLTHRLCQDTPNVCLTLETVVVNGCKRLTDRGLHVVAQCCPELRHLEVAGCYNISNEAVFEVVSRCPNLEHLNLSGKYNIGHIQWKSSESYLIMGQAQAYWVFIKEWLLPCITHKCGFTSTNSSPQSFLLKAAKIIRGVGEALPTLSSHVGEERLSLAESRTYLNMSKRSGLLLSLRKWHK